MAPKHRLEKLALVWLKKRPAVVTSIVARYRKPLEHLPLALDTDGCEVWLPEERNAGVYLNAKPLAGTSHRIALAPGAHHATKRWQAAKYAQLAQTLTNSYGKQIVLVGGPADVDLCSVVAEAAGVDILRLDGSTSIESTVRALDTCQAIVTNDSGVMHMAAARQVPVVAVFGSTVKDLGFAPYAVPSTVVEHDVSCRPCSHIGRSSCPKGHFRCMESISVEQVLEALTTFI
ncbi:MAG: glycosyltransferase family 9 protein [Candidatus Kapabacteria bacterium]|nr:glycosyltransferase family 9 protein [Candidatus Kapabacteria bacterium]